jgi:hypothetical protein
LIAQQLILALPTLLLQVPVHLLLRPSLHTLHEVQKNHKALGFVSMGK